MALDNEPLQAIRRMSTGGEVANALVCKTSIRGFNSRPVLHSFKGKKENTRSILEGSPLTLCRFLK
jgi:hypothetical protein